MNEIWNRIETWLKQHAPHILQSLEPPATVGQITETEDFLGVKFPDIVRASYAIHNGQSDIAIPLMGEWKLLSLKVIAKQWKVQSTLLAKGSFGTAKGSPIGPAKDDWYNARWIPLAYNGGGDFICLDLDPAAGGTSGQMLSWWHVDDKRERLASDFSQWLARFAEDLEKGEYRLEDEVLVRREKV